MQWGCGYLSSTGWVAFGSTLYTATALYQRTVFATTDLIAGADVANQQHPTQSVC
jgi:hypothetical protein